MSKQKTTIIIMSNDGNPSRTINVNSKLVYNFQKYAVTSISVLVFIGIMLFSLFAYIFHLSFKNGELNANVFDLRKQNEVIDSVKLKERLSKIDENLSAIDVYLHQRGVFETESVGGEAGGNASQQIPMVEYYEEQSEMFLNTLKFTPLGMPFYGRQTSGYGYRTNPFGGHSGEFHPGIDFKGEVGDPIFATANGTVERCDWYGGYGNAVVLRHTNELTALYGHMSKVNVVQGQEVKAGDLIGFIGSTGRSTGSHLHYEIRRNNEDINPVPFLKLN